MRLWITAGILCVIIAFGAEIRASEMGTVIRDTPLMAAPYKDSKAVSAIEKDQTVEIAARKGGWLQVSSSKGKGWVRMLSIKRGAPAGTDAAKEASGVLGIASGRAGTGRIVATTGIRGLSEEDLKTASFNEAQVKKAESFTVSRAEAESFAKQAKLIRQNVHYLSEPSADAGEKP